jgi:NAD(P)-dependent dehydrogenase (short-subunit alcohol dehydrogenase family)
VSVGRPAGASARADGALRLDGRRALVTGASRGIGAAIARAFAAAGAASVALLARGAEALERVADDVERLGTAPRALACDVTDPDALKAAFAEIALLDVLVCAAGTNVPQPLEAIDLETADHLWALNVRAGLQATQLAVRRMPPSGGAVVFVSSQMGHVGAPRRSVYCATKHAVEGMTKALAVELAPRGIRVVSIAPTFVATELTAPFLEAEGDEILARIPLGRLATLEEVADAAVFAASAGALTGCSIKVDGGWTAQ